MGWTERRGHAARRRLPVALVLLAALAAPALPAAASAAPRWSGFQLPAKVEEGGFADQVPLYGVSCAGEKLCVAVGALDTVAVSRSPTGGREAWDVTYPEYPEPVRSCLEEEGVPPASCSYPRGSLDAVSCPTEGLCVAVGYEGSVYVSTDPTAGAWSIGAPYKGPGQPHLTGVSCPSASLCVAVSGGNGAPSGRVFTTTAPSAGVWQSEPLPGSPDLRAVSCTAASLCVAVAKAGRIFVSTDPTAGAGAWREVASPTPQDLEAVDCLAALCAAGDGGGNVLTSTEPTGSGFAATNAGGAVQLTGLSCPTATACVGVDDNADVVTSTDPTGPSSAWSFENLIPFEAQAPARGQFVKNALWGAECPSTSLCLLVGANSRIFTAIEPFAAPASPAPSGGGPGGKGRATRKRPRTHLVFAEGFYVSVATPHRRIEARFHFYSRDGAKGFECRRDRGRWRPCRSPLRYWVGIGRHALRVRAIGRTGLRGPVATVHFRVAHRQRG